jgi:hypothetical protein
MLDVFGARLDHDLHHWRRAAASVLWRDRAISRVLRIEHARLSAALVQPGLFSNRTERMLTPQLQLLDQSVARLQRASLDMRAVGHIGLESASPLFAAVLR